MAGLGASGIGLTPFGPGTPDSVDAPSEYPWGSRWINPATKQFEYDSITGQLRQMPAVRQRVLLAVLQTRGSSTARPAEGIRRPRKMGDGFEREQEQHVRTALRRLTDVEQLIRIEQVIVSRRDGMGAHTEIVYTDLTTGLEDQVEV